MEIVGENKTRFPPIVDEVFGTIPKNVRSASSFVLRLCFIACLFFALFSIFPATRMSDHSVPICRYGFECRREGCRFLHPGSPLFSAFALSALVVSPRLTVEGNFALSLQFFDSASFSFLSFSSMFYFLHRGPRNRFAPWIEPALRVCGRNAWRAER